MISSAQIARLEQPGKFPKRVRIGEARTSRAGWRAAELSEWLKSQRRQRGRPDLRRSLYRIEAPHFVAGLETETHGASEVVVHAAPILKWTKGKTMTEVLRYVLRRKWNIESNIPEPK